MRKPGLLPQSRRLTLPWYLPLMLISKRINLHIKSKLCEFLFFYSGNKSWASVHSINHIIFHSWSFQAIIIIIRTSPLPESSKPYLHAVCSWDTGGVCILGSGREQRAGRWWFLLSEVW